MRVFVLSIVATVSCLATGVASAQTSYPMIMSVRPVAAQVGQTSEHTVQSRYDLYGAYKLLVSGLAPHAARYAGFAQKQAIWIGLLVGGAMAGLAGVAEIAGPLGLLQRNVSPGYGFAAIIVAFLGGLHPIGIVFAALLMALIYVGGDMSLISVGLPHASITVFQGMLLIFYLASYLFVHYRVTVPHREHPPDAEQAEHA